MVKMVVETRADGYVNASKLCKASKKLWGNYFQNNRTHEFLEELAGTLDQPKGALIQSQKGGVSQGTWVHPTVLPDLQRWCSEKKKMSSAGYIYAVTSDVLNAVKIGMWRGSIDNLRARYLTPYGPSVEFSTAIVEDCVVAEASLHNQFKQHSLGGELFDKRHHETYKEALRAIDSVQ